MEELSDYRLKLITNVSVEKKSYRLICHFFTIYLWQGKQERTRHDTLPKGPANCVGQYNQSCREKKRFAFALTALHCFSSLKFLWFCAVVANHSRPFRRFPKLSLPPAPMSQIIMAHETAAGDHCMVWVTKCQGTRSIWGPDHANNSTLQATNGSELLVLLHLENVQFYKPFEYLKFKKYYQEESPVLCWFFFPPFKH